MIDLVENFAKVGEEAISN